MKTVLHLIETSGPGGAENMLISLARGLQDIGFRCLACLLRDGWLRKKLEENGVRTLILPLQGPYDVGWLLKLRRLVRSTGVDIIHAHEFAMNTYGSMFSAITGTPTLSTVHGKAYYWQKWRRRIAYRFASRHSYMVAVSQDIKNFLVEQVGIAPGRVQTILNGIEVDRYLIDASVRVDMRAALGISASKPVLGTVGNLYPVKGHDTLLQALADVKRHVRDIQLIVAGRGKLLPFLQTAARNLSISDNVHFLGFREDVPRLLQAMDVFVLPSYSEGLPLSLLEAMACGLPVVASRIGGIPEAVTDGDTGYLVPPRDARSLATAIIEILERKDLSYHMGMNSRKRVEDEFGISKMVKRYTDLYDRCFNSTGHS